MTHNLTTVKPGTLMRLLDADSKGVSNYDYIVDHGHLWVLVKFDEGDFSLPYHCRSLATGYESWFQHDDMEVYDDNRS